MQSRRWKAFLRLRGETLVDSDQDIVDEFSMFVQQLKRVGVDYSIIVNVEGGRTERRLGRAGQLHSLTQAATSPRKPVREIRG